MQIKYRMKITCFIALFCLISGLSFLDVLAEQQSLSGLIHIPVKNAIAGQPINFEAKIDDPSLKVEYVRLYFRHKGVSSFQYMEMYKQIDSYTLTFPGEEVLEPGIDYFIVAVLEKQKMISTPASNAYYSPYEIVVSPGKKSNSKLDSPVAQNIATLSGIELQTLILSPEPFDRVAIEDAIIAVSFLGEVDKLDINSIKIYINDKNVTSGAERSLNMLSLIPRNLPNGVHQVRVELSDVDGNRFDDIEWKFYITTETDKTGKPAKKRLGSFKGDFYAEIKNEDISDSTLTTSNMGLNFRGNYGKIRYRGKAYITSREKSNMQPRNRFTFEVGTEKIGIKFGDTSPRFNELILWGRRVRGIEAYLKFGFFNLEFVQGETNRKIEGTPYNILTDPVSGDTTWVNPVSGDTVITSTGIYRYGTYKQTLLGIRPSFGSGKYFQLGLNLLKVKDDVKSITYSTRPKDNLVIGPDLLIAFDDHNIEVKTSLAFSFLSNDISDGALSKADLDTVVGELPIDPEKYEKYFVLNTSLIPLDPRELTSLAFQTGIKLNYFNNSINFVYKSVGSEYYSLANSFIRKDIKGFSLFDRIRLYRNQIYLNLGLENYVEGISTKDDGEASTDPTDYHSFNVGVSFYPQKQFIPKVNVNFKNYDRNNGLDTTTTLNAIDYQNKDVSVQFGYDLSLLNLNHTLTMSYIMSDRVDGFGRSNSNIANDIKMFSLRTAYQVPLTTVLTYATNQNNAGEGMYNFEYNMLSFASNYRRLNGSLNLRGGFNITNAEGANTYTDTNELGVDSTVTSTFTNYKRIAYSIGGNYRFLKHHSVLLDMSFINFDDKVTKSYDDSIIRFRYEFHY